MVCGSATWYVNQRPQLKWWQSVLGHPGADRFLGIRRLRAPTCSRACRAREFTKHHKRAINRPATFSGCPYSNQCKILQSPVELMRPNPISTGDCGAKATLFPQFPYEIPVLEVLKQPFQEDVEQLQRIRYRFYSRKGNTTSYLDSLIL